MKNQKRINKRNLVTPILILSGILSIALLLVCSVPKNFNLFAEPVLYALIVIFLLASGEKLLVFSIVLFTNQLIGIVEKASETFRILKLKMNFKPQY